MVKGRKNKKRPSKSRRKSPKVKTRVRNRIRKKVRDYAKEYKRRIANAAKKGKSRQEARGHRKGEHIERAEREREEEGITKAQLKSVKSFLSRFNPREYKDVPTEEDLVEFIQEEGYAQFQQYRKVWDAARRTYVRELNDGSYESRGMPYLEFLRHSAGAPDAEWLYYH